MKLKLIKLKKVTSTNDMSIKLIKKNITKPTLITSLVQTNGRGTMGKKWISKKGNLFLSIFFEIDIKKINLKQFTILNVRILKRVINKYSKIKLKIKWPNDLLIKKKKVCGILQELIYNKGKSFLIVGIGINTNSFPYIENYKTTSLKNLQKTYIDNNIVLRDIKKQYENFIIEKKKKSFTKLKKLFF